MVKLEAPSQYGVQPNTYVWWMLCTLLALAPTHTKLAGAGWLLWVGYAAWSYKTQQPVSTNGTHQSSLELAARYWLIGSCVACLLRLPPVLYWGDGWGDRHFESRMLVAALATYVLMHRTSLHDRLRLLMLLALSVAGLCAASITVLFGRDTPTNPIPWAAAMGFMACVLVVLPTDNQPQPARWLKVLGLLGFSIGILLSQSRGAYPALVWLAAVQGYTAWTGSASRHSHGHGKEARQALPRKVLWGMGGLSVAALLLIFPALWQTPIERLATAWTESLNLLASATPASHAIDTSVGARLFMWQHALDAIGIHHPFGYGREQRLALIQQWGTSAGSTYVVTFGHVHNELLQAALDQGVFGLASVLSTWAGLLAAAWLCWKKHRPTAIGLLGLALVHISAGLTNVNTAHNYYGLMLGFATGMLFLQSTRQR